MNAGLYFHLGETVQAHQEWAYLHAMADKRDEHFQQYVDLALQAEAPPEVLQSIESYRQALIKVPLQKPWSQFTPEEQKKYLAANQHLDLWSHWLNVPDYQKLFFLHLGQDSLKAWYGVEADVTDRGFPVDSEKDAAREVLAAFDLYDTSEAYAKGRARLSPEALAAVRQLATLKRDLEDPLNSHEITLETIKQIGAAGRTLRDLSRAGKLVTK